MVRRLFSLEGDGFELSVPRERGHRFELSLLFMSPETDRVLSQRSTLLGAGGSKSRSHQANGANSRSLENVLASAERPDGASGNRKFESLYPPKRSLAGRHCRLAEPGRPTGNSPRILCFEHLERTCTPAGRPQRKSRGRLRFERQYRD